MSPRKKIVILWFIITLISIIVYSSIRIEGLEKEYVQGLVTASNRIGISLQNYQKDEALIKKDLPKFFQLLNRKYKNLGLIAIADQENRILNVNKNNRYFESNELLEEVIRDFQSGELTGQRGKPYLIRYYNQIRFYVFLQKVYEGNVLILFPYMIDRRAKTKMVLEILLIIVSYIILFAFIYLYLQKTGRIGADDHYRIANFERRREIHREKPEAGKAIEPIGDSIGKSVYELFNSIASNFRADRIELYILKEHKNRLEKKFELKEKAFFTIDATDFDSIAIDNEIGEELKNASIFVMESGKKITIPVLFRNTLIGAVLIIRETGFSGREINDIKIELEDISKVLSDYILLNDIVVDKETGLHSKSYFKLKYNEQKKIFLHKKEDFAVLLLAAFTKEENASAFTKPILIKKIASRITEQIGIDAVICRYDNYFAILLPHANKKKAAKAAGQLIDSLNNLDIAVGKGDHYLLKPFIGYTATEGRGENDILALAQKSLEYALTQNESTAQSVTFKNITSERT
jgi:GGDEF domain-containing protein